MIQIIMSYFCIKIFLFYGWPGKSILLTLSKMQYVGQNNLQKLNKTQKN